MSMYERPCFSRQVATAQSWRARFSPNTIRRPVSLALRLRQIGDTRRLLGSLNLRQTSDAHQRLPADRQEALPAVGMF